MSTNNHQNSNDPTGLKAFFNTIIIIGCILFLGKMYFDARAHKRALDADTKYYEQQDRLEEFNRKLNDYKYTGKWPE